MFFALKSMLLVCLLRCGSDYFKMFEIAQNITKLRVVANSIIFTTNPILYVKLCITKTNVFVMTFIYMLLGLLSEITQHTTITLNLFSEFQISIIIDNYLFFFPNFVR